jgi:hypothetical protein
MTNNFYALFPATGEETQDIVYNDITFKVNKRIRIEDKIFIIDSILNKCFSIEDGYYNVMLSNVMYKAFIIVKYTDLDVQLENIEDFFYFYDTITKYDDLFTIILSTIDKKDLEELNHLLNKQIEEYKIYLQSARGFIATGLMMLPDLLNELLTEVGGNPIIAETLEKLKTRE